MKRYLKRKQGTMKSDKVTVMKKAPRHLVVKRHPESPEGIGALMKHKSKQYSSERKASETMTRKSSKA